MFEFLLGSYSILDVIPAETFFLQKFISLYFCLLPPPLCLTVIFPELFRPAEFLNPFILFFNKDFFFKCHVFISNTFFCGSIQERLLLNFMF